MARPKDVVPVGDAPLKAAVSKGWPLLGDMVVASYITHLFGTQKKLADETLAGYDVMRRELEGPDPTPLERLAIERIVVCHATLHRVETLMAFSTKEMSINEVDSYQDRISRLQTRYLQAVRALAQIRKLDLPNVQINIAEKQVNVAGPG